MKKRLIDRMLGKRGIITLENRVVYAGMFDDAINPHEKSTFIILKGRVDHKTEYERYKPNSSLARFQIVCS